MKHLLPGRLGQPTKDIPVFQSLESFDNPVATDDGLSFGIRFYRDFTSFETFEDQRFRNEVIPVREYKPGISLLFRNVFDGLLQGFSLRRDMVILCR